MKKNILLQIDHDAQCSSFDSIVALDSGVQQLLTFGNVTPIQIQSIIHGAMFTRGQHELNNTAVFFGGSNVEKTSELFAQAQKCFFGPLRVSMMSDPNGSNTTAAAAVLSASKHITFTRSTVTVLAGTGPVGQRIGQLVSGCGARVQLCSRSLAKAQAVCQSIIKQVDNADLVAREVATPGQALNVINDSTVVFAAGAAGIELIDDNWLTQPNSVRVAVDVNAVPPAGIHGVELTDAGSERNGKFFYGAIGVGALKMKIHKQAIGSLFESNDAILDIDQIFKIGQSLLASQ